MKLFRNILSRENSSKWGFVAFLVCVFIVLGSIVKISYSSPVVRLEHFAFVFGIIGSMTTAVTLVWLVMERNQLQAEKREDEKRKQAVGVSTWLSVKPSGDRHRAPYQIVVLNNNSDAPIYNVIVSLVDARNRHANGEQTPEKFRLIVDASPPGQAYCYTPKGYGGGGSHPSAEIAFSDTNGRHWVRRGNGRLEELPEEPFVHYTVSQPPTYEQLFPMR